MSSAKESVSSPGVNDVLSGRGHGVAAHPGNVKFRKLVRRHKTTYRKLERREKIPFAEKIVKEILNLNPPGRFLQKDESGCYWRTLPHNQALLKTSQALREGMATARRPLQQSFTENATSSLSTQSVGIEDWRNHHLEEGESSYQDNMIFSPMMKQQQNLSAEMPNKITNVLNITATKAQPFHVTRNLLDFYQLRGFSFLETHFSPPPSILFHHHYFHHQTPQQEESLFIMRDLGNVVNENIFNNREYFLPQYHHHHTLLQQKQSSAPASAYTSTVRAPQKNNNLSQCSLSSSPDFVVSGTSNGVEDDGSYYCKKNHNNEKEICEKVLSSVSSSLQNNNNKRRLK